MVSAHPKIRWQMGKTPETIAFVQEAAVACFTREDLTETENYQLRAKIERLLDGSESIVEP